MEEQGKTRGLGSKMRSRGMTSAIGALAIGIGTLGAPGAIGLAVFSGLVLGAAPAGAQPMTQILRRTGLAQADINIMQRSAAPLYRGSAHVIGSETEWSNPDTGASGKSMLVAFQNNCADIRHTVITQRRPEPQEFTFRNCRTSDGNWVLAP